MSLEARVDLLERQVKALRQCSKHYAEFIDVVSSPLWKRVIWWFCGFYFRKVGRWYGPTTYQPRWPR